MTDKIDQQKLDNDFDVAVMSACQTLAMALFTRCKNNPDEGLKYLSNMATQLDCRLRIKFELEDIK
jgi:hypothetical protein